MWTSAFQKLGAVRQKLLLSKIPSENTESKTRGSRIKCMVKGQRETSDKGMGEFVGQ